MPPPNLAPDPPPDPVPDLAALTAALSSIAPSWRGRPRHLSAQPTGLPDLDALLPGGGWPTGALIELMPAEDGIGEVSLTLPALRQACSSRRRVIFIDPPFAPYPPALHGRDLPLDLTLWITTRGDEERIWAAVQLLRESATGAVLLWSRAADDRGLRRLQLAAGAGHGLAFLFRGAAALERPSPAAVRLTLRPANHALEICLHKARGGRPGVARIGLPAVRP